MKRKKIIRAIWLAISILVTISMIVFPLMMGGVGGF
jgi:hypothetical protein